MKIDYHFGMLSPRLPTNLSRLRPQASSIQTMLALKACRAGAQVPLYVVASSLALIFLVSVQMFWVGETSLVKDVNLSLDNVRRIQSDLIKKESALSPAVFSSPEIDTDYIELRFTFARLTSDLESLHAWNALWSSLPFMHHRFRSSTYLQYDMPTLANIDVASANLFLHAVLVMRCLYYTDSSAPAFSSSELFLVRSRPGHLPSNRQLPIY